MSMRYLAVVPARGGSKRIPGKNLITLGGKPLLDYTAQAAHAARCLAATVLTTDDDAIARRGRELQLLVLGPRPPELARDDSPLTGALQHVLQAFEASHGRVEAVVILQPTSPFRTGAHIEAASELFEASGADTLTAVQPARDHPYWVWRKQGQWLEPYVSEQAITTERAALPPAYSECGCIYIVLRDLVASGRIYGAKVMPYVVDAIAAVDIDTPQDLAWAEFLLQRRSAGGGSEQ